MGSPQTLDQESQVRARSNSSGCPRLPRPTYQRAHTHQDEPTSEVPPLFRRLPKLVHWDHEQGGSLTRWSTTQVPTRAAGAGGAAVAVHVARELGIHPEVLRSWIRRGQADHGERTDLATTAEREELQRLRRRVVELERANEILKAASAYFAGELDPTRRRS